MHADFFRGKEGKMHIGGWGELEQPRNRVVSLPLFMRARGLAISWKFD